MLINEKRALAYTARITDITPIEGADNIELVHVLGWTCIAKIGEFSRGDLCVYFEIDSKLPIADWSAFMEKRNYKVKTMKLGKFKVISQGLALPISAFVGIEIPNEEKIDVTELLGVTYSVEEDNKRKANSTDKYKAMAARHSKLFKNKFIKSIMKTEIGRKILFFFFGKKKDKKAAFPEWVKKTDEERVENMPWVLKTPEKWIATEKIDGTSTTFTMKRIRKNKYDYRVCSRNVVFDKPDKPCYYDSNVYLEMAKKYDVEAVLKKMLESNPNLEYITIQGETFGGNIQKRDYSMKDHDFRAFNLIYGYNNKGYKEVKRLNTVEMTRILNEYGIPSVPIIDESYKLPETIEELRDFVNSAPSAIDGKIKEGIVFRSLDGEKSFKCVSPEFLLKYHQ